MNNKNIIIIAIAMILSAFIMGIYFYSARKPVNTIRVVGYASGEYDSDILKWVLVFTTQTLVNNQMDGYRFLNRDINNFRTFLTERGFNANDLEISSANNWQNWGNQGVVTGFTFEQRVAFTLRDTTRFHEIERHAFDLSELAAIRVIIRQSTLEYYISTLPDAKIEIIAEATRDARERAQKVADTTNTRLGKLRTGRVGVFQITEPHSVEVQGMGIFNTSTRRKQISVTMTGEFELR